MSDILKVSGLVKYYDQFTLDHINISVPEDGVVGFIATALVILPLLKQSWDLFPMTLAPLNSLVTHLQKQPEMDCQHKLNSVSASCLTRYLSLPIAS